MTSSDRFQLPKEVKLGQFGGEVVLPAFPFSVKDYHGWGYHAVALDDSPGFLSVLLKEDCSRSGRRYSNTLTTLAQNAEFSPAFERVGIRWRKDFDALQVPLAEDLCRLWNSSAFVSKCFKLQIVEPGIFPRDKWQESISLGLLPVSRCGAMFIHDLNEHIPALALMRPDYAKGFQERLKFLLALKKLEASLPLPASRIIEQSIKLHEQLFEHHTVFISYNLGLLLVEPFRAAKNIRQIFDRMQRWSTHLGDPQLDPDLGDVSWCAERIIDRCVQKIEPKTQPRYIEAIRSAAFDCSGLKNRFTTEPPFSLMGACPTSLYKQGVVS